MHQMVMNEPDINFLYKSALHASRSSTHSQEISTLCEFSSSADFQSRDIICWPEGSKEGLDIVYMGWPDLCLNNLIAYQLI